MTPLKNFFHVLKKYKIASLLNVIGLSIAFASFMIIMTQVKYDLSFDRHYKNADRIFRVDNQAMTENGKYSANTSRLVAEKVFAAEPEIEKTGLIQSYQQLDIYDQSLGKDSRQGPFHFYTAEPDALDILEFEFVHGSPQRFSESGTVLISEQVATAIYGNQNPVGRSLIFDKDTEHPVEIVGVYKNFPQNATIRSNSIVRFIGQENAGNGNNWNYVYYIRLNARENAEQVMQAMNKKYQEFVGTGNSVPDNFFRLTPITETHFTQSVSYSPTDTGNRATVYSLMSIGVLIILIAMINFVNFSTSLIPTRIRSINVQKVLGGSNAAIRRNMIAESAGLAVVSFFVALLIVHAFSGTPLASDISAPCDVGADMPILWGTALIAVATGILSGIYPAFYSTSFAPALVVKGVFGLTPKGRRLRTVLISVQYAISITLIIVTLSIHRQNRYMQKSDMGFQRENILTTWVPREIADKRKTLADKLTSNPAITDVTFAAGPFVAKGRMRWGRSYKGKGITYDAYPVASNFLRFMGIRITNGRDFNENDDLKPEISQIFNETSQRKDSITVGEKMEDGTNIVGIARDFNFQPLQYGINPFAFVTFGTTEWGAWTPLRYLFVKTNGTDIPAVADFIRKSVKELVPDSQLDIRFMDEEIGNQYYKEQKLSNLLTLFSLLSILISIVGVFGLVLFETQYRRKEIGIRKIHGATVGEIFRMFNKIYVRIVLACFVVAVPIAYCIVDRWLENFAYKAPVEIWIYLAALAIVLGTTVATVLIQTYRAATDNPVQSLKKH